MTSIRKSLILATWIAAFVLIIIGVSRFTASAQQKPVNGAPKATPAAASGAVARGKYIVEDVAYCTNCHTPRNDNGQLDRTKWLQGGSLFWQPAHPVPNFPLLVPRIAGTIPATDDEMVTVLTTGVWKDGSKLREPMPQFRMTKEDAQAVVAYLKTLNTTELPASR